jgi:hypothetical protein
MQLPNAFSTVIFVFWAAAGVLSANVKTVPITKIRIIKAPHLFAAEPRLPTGNLQDHARWPSLMRAFAMRVDATSSHRDSRKLRLAIR